ncbi:hypothetical protein ABIA14_004818 [Sinorhizobium fredii]
MSDLPPRMQRRSLLLLLLLLTPTAAQANADQPWPPILDKKNKRGSGSTAATSSS